MENKEPVPVVVQNGFASFFQMGAEAQDLAIPLLEEAAQAMSQAFAKIDRFNKEAAMKRWKEYISLLGDKLAQSLDPIHWPGHGDNGEIATQTKNRFMEIFKNQSPETLLQTINLVKKVVGK